MDVEKLISLINERKPLRDMTDKSYHMRGMQRKLWQEVAVELSANVDEIKNKWRGLRKEFKTKKKSKKRKSGDGAESVVTSKWPYYKLLLFLCNTVERRKLHGNVSPRKKSDNNSDIETESILESADNAYSQSTIQESSKQISNTDIQQPSISGTRASNTLSSPTTTVTSQHKKNTQNHLNYTKNSETLDEKFLKIEKAKLNILSQSENKEDSEYQFLTSLLPFLKAIPRNRQMLVRNKLQQVFVDEEQLSIMHTTGVSYRSNTGMISTPLPSPMSFTNTDSSRASLYSNDLVSPPTPVTFTNVECTTEYISSQQALSIHSYMSGFRD